MAQKDKKFLNVVGLIVLCGIGISATMTGIRQLSDKEEPVAAPAAKGAAPAVPLKVGSPVRAMRVAKAKRNAQNLVSVYSSAMAAGSPRMAAAKSAEEAVVMMMRGVKGGGPFADTVFQVPNLSEKDAKEALVHMRWGDQGLIYEVDKQVEREAGPLRVTKASRRKIAIRNAQNIASVSASAIAAGSVELAAAGNLDKAVELLTGDGVSGGGSFAATTFLVPNMEAGAIEDAKEFLEWNDAGKYVEFHRGLMEQVRKRHESRMAPGGGLEIAIARAEALNMATAAFIQSRGLENAEKVWDRAGGAQQRYSLIAPFLAFAPAELDDYLPDGFTLEMLDSLRPVRKVKLLAAGRETAY